MAGSAGSASQEQVEARQVAAAVAGRLHDDDAGVDDVPDEVPHGRVGLDRGEDRARRRPQRGLLLDQQHVAAPQRERRLQDRPGQVVDVRVVLEEGRQRQDPGVVRHAGGPLAVDVGAEEAEHGGAVVLGQEPGEAPGPADRRRERPLRRAPRGCGATRTRRRRPARRPPPRCRGRPCPRGSPGSRRGRASRPRGSKTGQPPSGSGRQTAGGGTGAGSTAARTAGRASSLDAVRRAAAGPSARIRYRPRSSGSRRPDPSLEPRHRRRGQHRPRGGAQDVRGVRRRDAHQHRRRRGGGGGGGEGQPRRRSPPPRRRSGGLRAPD